MPLFDFKAIGPNGKVNRGTIDAENAKAARLKLKKQGFTVTDINEKTTNRPTQSASLPFLGGSVPAAEIAMMTRQLASLVKANIPLVEALNALVEQIELPALKVIVAQVRQDVNEGSSLARAVTKHPKVFDNVFINMIEAGESSGTLGLVLLRLADLKEAQMRLRSKVISGMTYPALMMLVAVGLMIAIFTFVIPKLAQIFEQMNKQMPPLTAFLIGMSGFIIDYWYALLTGFGLVTFLFIRWKSSATGKPKWDAITLRVPVVGNLVRMVAITRFAGTMGTLLGSGVPILSAMNIAKNLVANAPIANAIMNARENITEGQSIAEPLRKSGMFPPVVIHMIAIGEKTGELPEMLRNVAASYEEQVNTKIEGLTSLLEPIMIIGMGGVVAVIVLSIFVPLLDISNIG
jgi:general secretion pathway protein F